MAYRRVSSTKTRLSFEELATVFEGSGVGGAEKAYRRVGEKLTRDLVEDGAFRAIELRKRKTPPQSTNIRVDYDGEQGELLFDFENGTAKIVRPAEWYTVTNEWICNHGR